MHEQQDREEQIGELSSVYFFPLFVQLKWTPLGQNIMGNNL